MNEKVMKEEVSSLNKSLFDELSIEELESRLETDPLAIGQLIQLTTSAEMIGDTRDCCQFNHCLED